METSPSDATSPRPSTEGLSTDTRPTPSQNSNRQELFQSDAVNQQLTAEDVMCPVVSRILIIYTGGTIGMKNTPEHGYLPIPGFLSRTLASMNRFHNPAGFVQESAEDLKDSLATAEDSELPLTNSVNVPLQYPDLSTPQEPASILTPDLEHLNISMQSPSLMPSPMTKNLGFDTLPASTIKDEQFAEPIYTINGTRVIRTRKPALISPLSLYGKRTRYSILEYEPLLDSSNMTMKDWVKIATDIEVNYKLFDAFIILHGTDTMAYTASALSFMLENLGKTVIITGSQVPLSELRNDAVDNLLGALTIASHFVIPEVGLYFDNKLFRGNRCSKMNAIEFDAFDSPNLRPLVKVGINIDVSWSDVWRPTEIAHFRAQKIMRPQVATLRLFPGITASTVQAFLSGPIDGLVLETFGSGNAPNNHPELLKLFKEASDRGVVIVNCTQCKKGLVTDLYATGRALLECGVIPGSDMTTECALTKLCYLLSKYPSRDQVRSLMRKNLRGELTIPVRRTQFSYLQSQGLVPMILSLLRHKGQPHQYEQQSEETDVLLEKALVPMALCQAAKTGDVKVLESLTRIYPHLLNAVDYDGRVCRLFFSKKIDSDYVRT
jgi:lysophospholipase